MQRLDIYMSNISAVFYLRKHSDVDSFLVWFNILYLLFSPSLQSSQWRGPLQQCEGQLSRGPLVMWLPWDCSRNNRRACRERRRRLNRKRDKGKRRKESKKWKGKRWAAEKSRNIAQFGLFCSICWLFYCVFKSLRSTGCRGAVSSRKGS